MAWQVEFRKVEALCHVNGEIAQRIAWRVDSGRPVVVDHEYPFRFDPHSQTFEVNPLPVTRTALAVVQETPFDPAALVDIPDTFNDRLNFQPRTFQEVAALNAALVPVVAKYRMFEGSDASMGILERILVNLGAMQAYFGRIEELLTDAPPAPLDCVGRANAAFADMVRGVPGLAGHIPHPLLGQTIVAHPPGAPAIPLSADGSTPFVLEIDMGQNWTFEAEYLVNPPPFLPPAQGTPRGMSPHRARGPGEDAAPPEDPPAAAAAATTLFSYGDRRDGVLVRTRQGGVYGDNVYLKGDTHGKRIDLFGGDSTRGLFVPVRITYTTDAAGIGTLRVYVRGVLEPNATTLTADALCPADKTVRVGSAHHDHSEGLDGMVRNIRITLG